MVATRPAVLKPGQGPSAAGGMGAVLQLEEAVRNTTAADAPPRSLVRTPVPIRRARPRLPFRLPVIAADQTDGRVVPKAPEGTLATTPAANGHPSIPGETPRTPPPGRGLGSRSAPIAQVVARILGPTGREAVLKPVRPNTVLLVKVAEGPGRPAWRLRAPATVPVTILLTTMAP